VAFAIGESGELFSWGLGEHGTPGHGDRQDQRTPKRVEALRNVRVSSVAVRLSHALALAEDGRVYAWSADWLNDSNLRPKQVKALRSVRVGSVAACLLSSYAAAETGEVWA
jgi:hypothetical protein